MKAERCRATAKSGKPCQATIVDGQFCAWHSPAWAERRRQWSAEGGRQRSSRARMKKALPNAVLTAAELQGLVGHVLRDVIAGKTEPSIGNCVANLARALVTVREATTLEERIGELEQLAGLPPQTRWRA